MNWWMKLSAPAAIVAALMLGTGCTDSKPASSAGIHPLMADDAMPADPAPAPAPSLTVKVAPAAGAIVPVAAVDNAVAIIQPIGSSKVHGTVTFTQTDAGVKVVADLTDLPPGKHGFHIHEFGDISDTDKGMSTGGHFDPEGTHHHGLVDAEHPDGGAHHAGDMGNITADESGKAHLEITLPDVTIMGAKNPIVGRAVIVHEKPDDGGQPTGNAGGRIGMAVIGISKAPAAAK